MEVGAEGYCTDILHHKRVDASTPGNPAGVRSAEDRVFMGCLGTAGACTHCVEGRVRQVCSNVDEGVWAGLHGSANQVGLGELGAGWRSRGFFPTRLQYS